MARASGPRPARGRADEPARGAPLPAPPRLSPPQDASVSWDKRRLEHNENLLKKNLSDFQESVIGERASRLQEIASTKSSSPRARQTHDLGGRRFKSCPATKFSTASAWLLYFRHAFSGMKFSGKTNSCLAPPEDDCLQIRKTY
jgi:hypothetical protein